MELNYECNQFSFLVEGVLATSGAFDVSSPTVENDHHWRKCNNDCDTASVTSSTVSSFSAADDAYILE